MDKEETTPDVSSPGAPTSRSPQTHNKKWWLIGSGAVIALLIVAGVAFALIGKKDMSRDGAAQSPSENSSQGGAAANAAGLVQATALECVPRGHDNYRTNSTLAVDPGNPNKIYVGVEYKGVFVSNNGGDTWQKSDYGIRGYPKEGAANEKCIQELGKTIIDPTNSSHLIISRVESPGDLTTLFTENAGLWETTDSGAHWKQIVRRGMNASGSRAIAFDPSNPKTIYYGTNNMTPSFTNGSGQKSNTNYFNTTGILYKTTDGGAQWAELPTGAEHGFRAMDIGIDRQNPKTIWLFTFSIDEKTNSFPDGAQKTVIKSTDGGKTWTSLASAFPSGYRVPISGTLNPNDGNNAFVPTQTMSGQQKSFVTTDGGKTWTASDVYMMVVAFDPADSTGKRLLGYNPYEGGGGIYQSTDKGATWTRYANVPPEVNNSDKLGVRIESFAFSKSAPGTIYMGGSNANVWKSVDNGKTWKNILNIDKVGGQNKNKEGSTKSREQDPSGR